MTTKKISEPTNESLGSPHADKKIASVLRMLVRMLGLVNGTITIHARGGQLCRGIEIVNKVDVLHFD